MQRHPGLWRDPDRFDPERSDGLEDDARRLKMCPFGAGPRNCIGEVFARVEIQVHLMVIASELLLRAEDTTPAEISAGVNLMSRDDFITQPELRDPTHGMQTS